MFQKVRKKNWRGFINIYTSNGTFLYQAESTWKAVEWIKNNTRYKNPSNSHIAKVCNGKLHTAYGFIFKYTKEKSNSL
jgi:hypothetical protein